MVLPAETLDDEKQTELYDGLVMLCQQYGFTTDHTYECLHNAVESIRTDDDGDDH